MNYIELINNFWRLHQENNFSPTEIALYFYLLNVSNGLGWKNPFNQANTYIVGVLGISEKTLYTARIRLVEVGLIEFESGNGRRLKSTYLLKGSNNNNLSGTLFKERGTTERQEGSNNNNLSEYNDSANNKQNKTKQNITINIDETNVSTRVSSNSILGDIQGVFIDSDTNTPASIESPLNGKFEENNSLVIIPSKKEKSCAKKESKTGSSFVKPTLEEVKAYCEERRTGVDPEKWFDYYTSNGWRVGKTTMKDWRASVRYWERNEISTRQPPQSKVGSLIHNIEGALGIDQTGRWTEGDTL